MKRNNPADPVLKVLRKAIREHGGQKQVAQMAYVSTQFVNDVLHGRRDPSGDLLTWLGFERIVTYRRVKP